MICFYNGFYQDMFVSILILMVGFCFVIPLFSFITVINTMTIPQIVIEGAALVQAPMCITMAFGTFGGSYEDSIETENSNLETNKERKNFCESNSFVGSTKCYDWI